MGTAYNVKEPPKNKLIENPSDRIITIKSLYVKEKLQFQLDFNFICGLHNIHNVNTSVIYVNVLLLVVVSVPRLY